MKIIAVYGKTRSEAEDIARELASHGIIGVDVCVVDDPSPSRIRTPAIRTEHNLFEGPIVVGRMLCTLGTSPQCC